MVIQSNTFRLNEIKESALKGIEAINGVIAQQTELLQVLANTKTEHINDEFRQGIQKSTDQLIQRKADYEFNVKLIDDILARVDAHKNDELNELDAVVTMMLHIFTDVKIEEKNEQ